MKPPRPLARSFTTFFQSPPSIRNAIQAIVLATIAITLLGGLLVWMLDRKDFPTLGDAMWWALQTVTTVGYGDVTPKNAIGRAVGSAILLYSVAFLSILMAAITTSFIERARNERRAGGEPNLAMVMTRLDEISAKLTWLENHEKDSEHSSDQTANVTRAGPKPGPSSS